MNKIPTLFVRDPEDRRHLLHKVTPGCEWVMAGEGQATRKYDGTCVAFDGDDWWARREVKPGKQPPPNWHPIGDPDPNTGKQVGWEPIEQSGFHKFWLEAVAWHDRWDPGTYELCGPKVNGNPEGYVGHTLIRHDTAERAPSMDHPVDTEYVRLGVHNLSRLGWEGIVWHHPDGRMCKIKARDFA